MQSPLSRNILPHVRELLEICLADS